MSKVDDYAAKRSQRDPAFARSAEQYNINLDVAVKVRDLRDSLNMSQREFASLVHKPQSTIARIENGSMNTSTKLLGEIAQAAHCKVSIEFLPIT